MLTYVHPHGGFGERPCPVARSDSDRDVVHVPRDRPLVPHDAVGVKVGRGVERELELQRGGGGGGCRKGVDGREQGEGEHEGEGTRVLPPSSLNTPPSHLL